METLLAILILGAGGWWLISKRKKGKYAKLGRKLREKLMKKIEKKIGE